MDTNIKAVPPADTMGSRIRLARIAKGMTVVDLAAHCGVTRQTIHYWEGADSKIDSTMALRIAYHLDVRPEWLIMGRAPMNPNHQLRELQAVALQLPEAQLGNLVEDAYDMLRAHKATRPRAALSSALHSTR